MIEIIIPGKPIAKIEEDGDRDFWMTAGEATKYGMIDEILEREGAVKHAQKND